MADYILSNNNRYYAALESAYGVVPTIAASHRVPGARLAIATQKVTARRRDKTGTRTFLGLQGRPLKVTGYEFETSLMAQDEGALPPAAGQMVQAALGGAPQQTAAQPATVSGGGLQVDFPIPHGMSEGSTVNVNGELRFVESVPSPTSVRVCAPFTKTNGATVVFPSVCYSPAQTLPSVSLFDYWDPSVTVQRIVRGAGVDEMEIQVDGIEHRLVFRGPAAQHLDSVSFQPIAGALATFPPEPALQAETWAPVPGHLGQVWLGNSQAQVLTLTKAQIRVKNNLQTRRFEFGSDYPLALSQGEREVDIQFEVYSTDQNVFTELYQAAQTETPIPLTIQLGEQPGAMAAIHVKTFVPQIPHFDDGETRLLWSFESSRAQGTGDDEIYIAFG
jgi:hypothetical protein